MGFFDKIKAGLRRTTAAVTDQLNDLIANFVEVDEETLEELEEALILSDLGATVAADATSRVADVARHQRIDSPLALRCALKDVLVDMMTEDTGLNTTTNPSVILVIGVNGVGKTTSIGKLAHRYVQEGHRVMLSAADTFRAAAADQLEIWAKRAGADIVRHGEGADPAAVVFDSIAAAKARGCDIIIIDNGGRLDTSCWGGILANSAKVRGVGAVIVDGAARDLDDCIEIDFPVYARDTVVWTARGRIMEQSTNEMISFGGVQVHPGDVVMGDRSGVVIVPWSRVDEVLTKAEELCEREEAMVREILSGGDVLAVDSKFGYEKMLK